MEGHAILQRRQSDGEDENNRTLASSNPPKQEATKMIGRCNLPYLCISFWSAFQSPNSFLWDNYLPLFFDPHGLGQAEFEHGPKVCR